MYNNVLTELLVGTVTPKLLHFDKGDLFIN